MCSWPRALGQGFVISMSYYMTGRFTGFQEALLRNVWCRVRLARDGRATDVFTDIRLTPPLPRGRKPLYPYRLNRAPSAPPWPNR